MNIGNISQGVIRAGVIGAVALAISPAASASDATIGVAMELRNLRSTVAFAETSTVPQQLSFRIRQTGWDAVRSGCWHRVVANGGLVPMLMAPDAGALRVQDEPGDGFDIRTVVHLRAQDGGTIPLVLTREYTYAPAVGTHDGRIPFDSASGFGVDARIWKGNLEKLCHR